jgi:hypothetical protein
MPRREAVVVIDAEGRDKGKIFRLTELPAEQGEEWATRLLLALGKSGVEVPEGVFSMGMAGLAAVGIRAMGGLPWEVAKPLMQEMMACVQIQPGPDARIVRRMIPDDIEEVATRLRLRDEVINLHLGFSVRGFISNLRSLQEASIEQAVDRIVGTGPDTETSPPPSDG